MQILIVKDSSTKIAKDASAKEAETSLAAGFVVELVKADGSVVVVPQGSTADQIEALAKSLEQIEQIEQIEPEPQASPEVPADHAAVDEASTAVESPAAE